VAALSYTDNSGFSLLSMSSNSNTKVSLKLKKKAKATSIVETNEKVLHEFDQQEPSTSSAQISTNDRNEPLVIPLLKNKLRWKSSREDEDAAKALQQEAFADTTHLQNDTTKLVINSGTNRLQRDEADQYKNDLKFLPDQLDFDSDAFQRVPIADFGAALLRGMGWKDDSANPSGNEAEAQLPRPHRLGLGATPKALDPPKTRRRPDQVRKQEQLEQQQLDYQKQRERQRAMDKQISIQNESIVHVKAYDTKRRRAKIVQLVGVPGMNMVQIQYEREADPIIIKRGQLDGLVSREELADEPYHVLQERRRDSDHDAKRRAIGDQGQHTLVDDKRRDKTRRSDDKTNANHKQPRAEGERSSKRSKHSSWIIPSIRVRVITEKLGRRHLKQKGVVVDVTTKGATLKMTDGVLLDRVPDRYIETALPKAGGNAVVLAGKHTYAKGKLIERNLDAGEGVIQLYEDMNVLTLSLDDIAEWCGPLDDDMT
jgi:G patch domain/KOW motif-containing protein